jgi:lysine 6-dehydrogenase
MKVLVLGGCGIQGRTAVYDLAKSQDVQEVICADADTTALERIQDVTDMRKVTPVTLDAADSNQIIALAKTADVVIDLLPRQFCESVCRAVVQARTSLVFTNYGHAIRVLDAEVRAARISIMPECGLDPGIDLVVYGEAARRFDELHVINSYCGGFPEKAACDNPLNYKVSWTWDGVLAATKRPARLIRDGKVVEISAAQQHETDLIHQIDFPGLGALEAIPNGDAIFFTDFLGVTPTIRETGRYSLRWPGWSAFWKPLKRLGFLSDRPVPGLAGEVTPHQFMDKLLGPQLQYGDNEKDLVVMVNVFEGLIDGIKKRLTSRLLIARDSQTHLMAMSQGVGYPASIVAQMIARGEIARKGVLSPTADIGYQRFIDELGRRGIVVEETTQTLQ